jgi:lipopolysaccharide transport system ATP-binding protein
MDPIVQVNRVGKKYSRSPQERKRYSLLELWRELMGKQRSTELRSDEFWAVRDITFTMFPGDSIALVGRNGSGKTTLLKMLNGIVPIDEGAIAITENIQALINLGAGFHQNLSGRDNIYNSAALLGLSRKETDQIVDRVIAFSELQEFIDSPVSTYSSGMYARLGFSVAVHLQPRLVLIDEILSVGDQSFRNKCLKRMQEMKKNGVGMILVSHNTTQVLQFCERAIWMDHGVMRSIGDSKSVVKEYLEFLDKEQATDQAKERCRSQLKTVKSKSTLFGEMHPAIPELSALKMTLSSNGKETNAIRTNENLQIDYSFRIERDVAKLNVSIVFYNEVGEIVTAISTMNGDLLREFRPGEVCCSLNIPDLQLTPGKYTVVMPIHDGPSYLYRDIVAKFFVVQNKYMTWGEVSPRYTYHAELASGNKTFSNE